MIETTYLVFGGIGLILLYFFIWAFKKYKIHEEQPKRKSNKKLIQELNNEDEEENEPNHLEDFELKRVLDPTEEDFNKNIEEVKMDKKAEEILNNAEESKEKK